MNLDEIDIEQLIAYEGYEYRLCNGNSGPQINVKMCPNCGSWDYKVYFNAYSGLGNCFRCDFAFNKFNFVKISRGITANKGVFRYLEHISTHVRRPQRPKNLKSKINLDWKLPLNKRIELEEDVPQYLKDRNVNAKLCKRFDLRICENGFYKYTDFNERSKFVDFSNRIIIPVRDIENNLVTFQGRDIKGSSPKKYLFPNLLPGTGRYIYNSHFAISNGIKRVVLNEGVFDVFGTTRALETDVKYKDTCAVGTFGKHLSINHAGLDSSDQLADLFKMREKGVERLVIMWDGEAKALKAAVQAAARLKEFSFDIRVAKLPENLDPGEAPDAIILDSFDNAFELTTTMLLKARFGLI